MPEKKKKRLVLLDMHAILHRAFHALPAFSSAKGEPTGALYGFVAFLLKALRELKPDYIAACYDLPGPTFRHAAYEKYKGQRPELASDLALQITRSYDILKIFGIPFFEDTKFEADDIIATISEKMKKTKEVEIIVASGDLDTLALAEGERVKVFTLRKGLNDTVIYDEKKVEERFGFGPELLPDYKGLRGDPSDNIPGVPGIGEKGATELITKFGGLDEIFKALKKDKASLLKAGIKERIVGLLEAHEEEALFSRELGSVRKDVPIEFDLEKTAWPDGYDRRKVEELFKELGFISLLSRLPAESSAEVGLLEAEVELEKNLYFLKKEKKVFWHMDGEKIYTVGENKKAAESNFGDPALGELLSAEKSHYFFDAKKIFHTLSPEKPPSVSFDLKIAAWLSRPGLQNIDMIGAIHIFLPKESINEGDTLKATMLLPDLAAALEKEIKEKNLSRILEEIELPLIPVLFKMEQVGVGVDGAFLKKLSSQFKKKLETLQEKIWKMCGAEFNISSPRQLSEILFGKLNLTIKGLKKTGKGVLSTRESELSKLKGAHPVISEILSYRELTKIKSTYLDTIPKILDKEGRVHTTFDQTGAATGRLSSSDPNLQNIPIRSEVGREMRKAFRARDGFELIAFDFAQVELRIAAILSGDKKIKKAFQEGKDIHAITAAEVFNVPEEQVTEGMRREAKVINFGILYGMGVNALAAALEVPRAQAQEFWEEYFRDFAGVYEFLQKTKASAHAKGYVETLFGRRRYLPEIHSQAEYIRKEAERMAVNAPIQGTAADIVKLGMIRSQKLIEEEFEGGAFQILQIHDELLFEVQKNLVPKFSRKVRAILEGIYEGDVVLQVEVKAGPNWGEMKKYDIMK